MERPEPQKVSVGNVQVIQSAERHSCHSEKLRTLAVSPGGGVSPGRSGAKTVLSVVTRPSMSTAEFNRVIR
jgi:hypothetical protein